MKFKKFLCMTLVFVLLSATAILAPACGKKEPNAPVENPVTLGTTPAIPTKPTQPSQKPQKETEKTTTKASDEGTQGETTSKEKPTKKPSQKPTKDPEVTLPTASPTLPQYEQPTIKQTDPPTVAPEDQPTVPYNPSQTEIPKTPAAPAGSTVGTPNCAAKLVELLLSGNINEGDKSSTCSKMQIGIKNNGSSTMRIFPYGKVTVSDVTGYDRELSLINANGIALPYLDIPAGGTAYVYLRVLGNPTLFSTQKDGQITTVHFSFYYGNTIYDATCTAGVDGIIATKR